MTAPRRPLAGCPVCEWLKRGPYLYFMGVRFTRWSRIAGGGAK